MQKVAPTHGAHTTHAATPAHIAHSVNALMDLACTYALHANDNMARECAGLALEQAQSAGLTKAAYDVNEFISALGDTSNRRYAGKVVR